MSKNQRLIGVSLNEGSIVLRNNMRHEQGRPMLMIDRISSKISEVQQLENQRTISSKYSSAMLGIYRTKESRYLVLCDECTLVGAIRETKYFRVDTISYIPIELFANDQKNKDTMTALQDVQKYIQEGGMYFAVGGDITETFQHALTESVQSDRFVWNQYLLKPLREWNISPFWVKPMLQGYVGQFTTVLLYNKVTFTLISRRSHHQGGTRFHARGIDDDGNVANMVETEQILQYQDYLFSFVSVRGSVPIFWTQEGINNTVKMTRSFDLTSAAFMRHSKQLCDRYGRVMFINLMSTSKGQEQTLSDSFEKHFQSLSTQQVFKYDFFDYSAVCKKGYERLNPHVCKYNSVIESFSFFQYNYKTLQVLQLQYGVFRVNCLDCLDRTNGFMAKLYFISLSKQFKCIGMDLNQLRKDDVLGLLDESSRKSQYDFMINYKNMWADNGDQLSLIYAGTGAINSDVTREGKNSIFGFFENGMKSISRLYNSTFEDAYKQHSLNLLLHGMSGQQESELDIYMRSQEDQYCIYDTINLLIVSWNTNGKLPQGRLSQTLFNLEKNPSPDVVVLGLQEMVTLNPQNVMIMSNDSMIQAWEQLILNHLSEFGQYVKIEQADLVGIFITVYVRKQQVHRISQIEIDTVKTGLGGTLGNKGATGIKFRLDESQFVFINTHLSSGGKQVETRLLEIKDIHDRLFYKKVGDIDYRFFFGDMNFRIDAAYASVVQATESYKSNLILRRSKDAERILEQLIELDQLLKFKPDHDVLCHYCEGALTFLPTYKYDTGTDQYDTSKKMRTPSWCDRILFQNIKGGEIQQHFYNRQECKESDHKPISSYFTLEVKKVDASKKQIIERQYLQSMHTQTTPKSIFDQGSLSRNTKAEEHVYEDEFNGMVFSLHKQPEQQPPDEPPQVLEQVPQQQQQQFDDQLELL